MLYWYRHKLFTFADGIVLINVDGDWDKLKQTVENYQGYKFFMIGREEKSIIV